MSPTRAKVVLAASSALLIGVGAAWTLGAADPSANLDGGAVRSSVRTVPVTIETELAGSVDPDAARGSAVRIDPSAAERPSADADTAAAIPARPTFPKRIAIPSLGVDADVVAVGLEPDGSMEIPGATQAGWYHYGARPGDPVGSAVLAGHVDHEKQPGVFLELRRIAVGDDIEVTDDEGRSYSFRVTERFQVDKEALPGDELFRTDGDPLLTLITCGGRFRPRSRHYDDNIVIRAVPIGDFGMTRGRGNEI